VFFLAQVMDLRNLYMGLVYPEEICWGRLGLPASADQADYRAKAQPMLEALERVLENRPWLVGDQIDPADFAFYEMLFQHKTHMPDILSVCVLRAKIIFKPQSC